jgi:hypothetical protein
MLLLSTACHDALHASIQWMFSLAATLGLKGEYYVLKYLLQADFRFHNIRPKNFILRFDWM